MIKIGISMIKNWYSNYLYFNDQHFKKPMVPFVSWSLLSLGPFWPWSLLSLGPFWPWSLLGLGPFWLVPFGRSLFTWSPLAWSLLTSNVTNPRQNMNQRTELLSKCPHKRAFYLAGYYENS